MLCNINTWFALHAEEARLSNNWEIRPNLPILPTGVDRYASYPKDALTHTMLRILASIAVQWTNRERDKTFMANDLLLI